MSKMSIYLLGLALFVIYISATATATASDSLRWNLKSKPNFISEVKKLSLFVGDYEAQEGIIQLAYKAEIEVGEEKIKNNVSKVWYFPDNNALQDYGTEVVSFNEISESVRINEVAVLKPNGGLVYFDQTNVQILDSDKFNVFSHTKNIVMPYPGLEVGSLAFINYDLIVDKSKIEAEWSDIYFPQNIYPREYFSLNIRWKENNKLIWGSNSKFLNCVEQDNAVNCSAANIPAAALDYSVRWMDELGQFVVSEARSWNQVINTAHNAFTTAIRPDNGVDDVIKELTKNKSDRQKIAEIHEFVARDIRYISVSKNGHSITPHTVADTLKNRYGDCKDKSALLVELLKRIGLNAYPVLIATDRSNPSLLDVPAMTYFDHMVVCYDQIGGAKCLDATDQYTDPETTSAWIQGKVTLKLKPDEIPSITKFNKYRWNVRLNTRLILTGDGGATENQDRVYMDEYAGYLRSILAAKSKQELNVWALDDYHRVVSKDVDPVFTFSGIESLGSKLEVKSQVSYKPFINVDEELSYYEYDSWLRDELEGFYVKNKVYGYSFPGIKIESNYLIDISSRWKINGGSANLNLVHGYGSLIRQATIKDDNKVIYTTNLKVPARYISVDEMEDFNKFLDILRRESIMHIYGDI